MKIIIQFIFFTIVGLIFISCDHTNSNPIDNPQDTLIPCPQPIIPPEGGLRLPLNVHLFPRVSYDGSKLAYVINYSLIGILNLNDNSIVEIDFQNQFSKFIQPALIENICWCPYSNNKLIVNYSTYTDTIGNGKEFILGQNLYLINLADKSISRITPPSFGLAGNRSLLRLIWLKGSTTERDSIFIGRTGFYILQEDKIYPSTAYNDYEIQSRDGKFLFGRQYKASQILELALNNEQIIYNENVNMTDYVSLSPDNKKIAISLFPYDTSRYRVNSRYHEIWILDVDNYLKNIPNPPIFKMLNLRKLFCKYAVHGLHAEYITNNHLAVSMHEDGAILSPLWEITDDGKLIRQLTK